MAARLNNRLSTHHRESIQTAQLINRVYAHATGQVEMTPTQLRAAEILLKKTLPDLQSIEYTGEMTFTDATQLTREELQVIAAGGRAGVIAAGRSSGEPITVQ